MNQYVKNLLILHITVLIFGLTGIFGKLLEELGLDSANTVFYRVVIGALGMLVYALLKRKSLQINSLKQILTYAFIGGLICTHWYFFFESIALSNVSVALATISTTSLFLALLQPLLTPKKLVWYEILLGVIVIIGLVIILGYEFQYRWGILYSLIAALLAAIFSLLNSNLVQNEESTKISFYEITCGALFLGVFLHCNADLTPISDLTQEMWLWLLLLGLIATSFAFIASVQVMKVLSPFTVSLTINLEPLYSIVLALIIFGQSEHMSPQFYMGAVLILSTLFANAFFKRRERQKNPA